MSESSLTHWVGVILLGLCASGAHATQENNEKKTSYKGSCSDTYFKEFYDCRQKTRLSLKSKDDIGAMHTKCFKIPHDIYRECTQREKFQMKETFDNLRNKGKSE